MIPDIDSTVGMLCYSTKSSGCGGSIKASPEDFDVSEIISAGAESSIKEDGPYPVYSLAKKNIDTNHALSDILKKTRTRLYSMGLKDANATTTQYVYSKNKTAGIAGFQSSRYALRRLGYTQEPLSKKHMIANRFTIKISDNDSDFSGFDGYQGILNYYGYQRFGSTRPVTHLIGKALVQKRYSDAIDYILSHTSRYDSAENTQIRSEMADPSRYKEVYPRIPPRMDLERTIVGELVNGADALHAIRKLPVQMRRFYVQAYQSYLFNLTLSGAYEYGEDLFAPKDGDVCYDAGAILGKYTKGSDQRLAIPVVGYAYYKKTRFDYYISKIIREQGITPADFYIKDLQEASNEGGFRNASIGVRDFEASRDVRFTLSRGCFATILMREIIKPQEPLSAGF